MNEEDSIQPDWFRIIKAAKYLGCSPFELLKQNPIWVDWAFLTERASEEARKRLE